MMSHHIPVSLVISRDIRLFLAIARDNVAFSGYSMIYETLLLYPVITENYLSYWTCDNKQHTKTLYIKYD
jgi:hypothetical protein